MRQLSVGLAAMCGVSVVLCVAVWAAPSGAKEGASVLVEKPAVMVSQAPATTAPANGPILPPPSNPNVEAPAQLPAMSEVPIAKQPFLRPAAPRRPVPATTALAIKEEPMPAPDVPPEFEVRPTPPIEYDTDGDARRMYRSSGEIKLIMLTEDPADHCVYEIPLCIPGCCVDEPVVRSGQGIFGRGVVEYCWPSCGFRAIVKFRHVLGDVRVDYEGD